MRRAVGKKETLKEEAGSLDIPGGESLDPSPEELRTRFPALSLEDSKLLRDLRDPFRGLNIKDRKWRLRKYKQCFVADDVGLLFALLWAVSPV
jgi:hypothetical protein